MKFIIIICIFFTLPCDSSAKLRVVTEHLPPYQIVNNNKLTGGTSAKLTQMMLNKADYSVCIEVLPWARAYSTALTKKNTIIFSMTRSEEREKQFHWIGILRKLKYYFYTLKENHRIQLSTIEDSLKYKAVAVRNSFEAQSLIKIGFVPDKNLILTSNYFEAWRILLKGRADLTFANMLIGDSIYALINQNINPFVKAQFNALTSNLYIAANINTSSEIIYQLQSALESVKNKPIDDKAPIKCQ